MEFQNRLFVEKIINSKDISKIVLHPNQHKLLYSTPDSLQSFWMTHRLHFNMTKDMNIKYQIQDMLYLINNKTNQNVAVFSIQNELFMVQESRQQCFQNFNHNLEITHLVTDLSSINPDLVLTVSLDLKIRLLQIPSSKSDRSFVTDFSDNQYPITELFWKNSLLMIGDQAGYVNLTDINTKKIIHKQRVHYTPISGLSTFTDFTFNNVYYTFSKDEKVVKFFDLRNNKSIINATNLKVGEKINKIFTNNSGKVLIGNEEQLEVFDIYAGYRSIGNFKCRDQQTILKPFNKATQNREFKLRQTKIKTQDPNINQIDTSQRKQVLVKIDQQSNMITKYACQVGYIQNKSPNHSLNKSIKKRDCKLATSYNSKKNNYKTNISQKKYFSDFCLNNNLVYAGDTNGNVSILNLDLIEKKYTAGFGLYGPIDNLCWADNVLYGRDGKGDVYMATFSQKKKKINKQN